MTFEKQGKKDKSGRPIERRGKIFNDIHIFQSPGAVQMPGEKGGEAFMIIQKPDEDDKCRYPERRLSELKGDDE